MVVGAEGWSRRWAVVRNSFRSREDLWTLRLWKGAWQTTDETRKAGSLMDHLRVRGDVAGEVLGLRRNVQM